MGDNGYIKLSRKFFKNSYWAKKRTFSLSEAWLDLIQLARFDAEPTHILLPNGRQITIERGEIHASLRFLSSRWCWSVEKTLRYINNHKEKQEIEHRTERGESILKLCKYDSYNPLSNEKPNTESNSEDSTEKPNTQSNGKPNTETTHQTEQRESALTHCKYDSYNPLSNEKPNTETIQKTEHQTKHQTEQIIRKIKKEKKEYKKSTNVDEKVSFDSFWNQYHEITGIDKTDKAAAEKHWGKLKESEKGKAIERIPDYWAYVSGRKGRDGQVFVKKARTYLSDKNFNDEYGKFHNGANEEKKANSAEDRISKILKNMNDGK